MTSRTYISRQTLKEWAIILPIIAASLWWVHHVELDRDDDMQTTPFIDVELGPQGQVHCPEEYPHPGYSGMRDGVPVVRCWKGEHNR